MESSSNHMACLLKIESNTWGWERSLEDLLNTIDVNFMIDNGSRTVYAYGNVHPQRILEMITKAGKRAKMIWSNNGCRRPMEYRDDHFMEQCRSYAPNGLLDYHHQLQCHYPQPNRMMNLYQPCPQQTFALPPPYSRQLHLQPPPPPFVFHQNEPEAVLFPPTPAPPENFTMGDLHSGCMIM